MSTTQVDTSQAGISDPNSVEVLSRWILRFDGGYLVISGSAALLADLRLSGFRSIGTGRRTSASE
jgi:hypothetical protein